MDPHAHAAVSAGIAALTLRQLDDTRFEGDSLPMPGGRVFGGQVLAQALIAAGHTVDEDRALHSMHGYFLRPGDASESITFEVEVLRDGRSFTTRRTHAFQKGVPILSMISSFQQEQTGPEHQPPMPDAPAPEQVRSGVEVLSQFPSPAASFWLTQGPFDVRHVEGSIFAVADAEHRSRQMTWLRVRETLDVSDVVHRALLTFGADQVMLEPALRRHGAAWSTPSMAFASLDHAMWWHRPARADEWLLFVQDSPTAQGGRGLSHASIFAQDGRLVASTSQEGMLRIPVTHHAQT